ncbi:hypothetical protein BHE74_00034101 [Ensete ventricosum]|nr:hypothetical protein BHE74_00034101 [Ensete ventricosum]
MTSSSASTSQSFLLFLFLCLLQPFTSHSHRVATTTNPTASKVPSLSHVLPLRAQKVPSLSLPTPPNKLLFHHNVTLTVPLAVGSPPQNVTMVFDTGSELSWLLCNSSSAAALSFDPQRSSSYYPVPCSSPACSDRGRDLPMPPVCDASSTAGFCHFYLSYADASTAEGVLATDSFLVGSSSPLPTVFGCVASTYSSTGGDTDAAGLLGMNRGSLSFVNQSGIRRFSYCVPDDDASGVVVLGDAEPPFPLSLNYTPLIQISLPLPYFDRVAYTVQLEGIRVGDTLLPIPKSVLVPDHTGAGQTMVDSGTQFTFLLGPAYDALKLEFSRQTSGALVPLDEPDFVFQGAFDLCFRLPAEREAPPPGLPMVVLLLRGGAEVAVAGERLLYRAAGESPGPDAVWCFTFGNSDLVPLSAYVIGHHHQQNLWVAYDLENARIGFAPARCDQASRLLGVASP